MLGHMKKLQWIVLALVWSSFLWGDTLDSRLNQLSISEKVCIENFFATAIRFEQLGHVLFFANKPASLVAMRLTGDMIPIEEKAFLNGWLKWKKNEHLFPHPNFIVCAEIANFKCPEKFLHIYIVNKKAMLTRLTEFEDLFKEILGEGFTKEAFLDNLEKTQKLSLLIKNDDALRGILLGFDKESVISFKKKQTGELQKGSNWKSRYQRINCEGGGKHIVHPVVFMGNPETGDVQNLKKTYEEELEPIQELYQKKDFLKEVLSALSHS